MVSNPRPTFSISPDGVAGVVSVARFFKLVIDLVEHLLRSTIERQPHPGEEFWSDMFRLVLEHRQVRHLLHSSVFIAFIFRGEVLSQRGCVMSLPCRSDR